MNNHRNSNFLLHTSNLIERQKNIMSLRRKMEGTASTHNTKISDSAYSNSCSNSQSQRSGSSSKSRESNCSGSSSGYGGKEGGKNTVVPQPLSMSKRSKDRKKKKSKNTIQTITDDTQKPDVKEIQCDETNTKVTGR